MNNDISKYTKPTFTADTSELIESKSNDLLGKQPHLSLQPKEAVIIVKKWLNDVTYDKKFTPPKPYRTAGSLLESRKSKATELIVAPVASCGSMVTLGVAILRAGGYAVKMIHGNHPKSSHHAWIEIYNNKLDTWEPYDFTGYGEGAEGNITTNHRKEAECADWFDIKDLLIKQHIEYIESKQKKAA